MDEPGCCCRSFDARECYRIRHNVIDDCFRGCDDDADCCCACHAEYEAELRDLEDQHEMGDSMTIRIEMVR